MTKIRSRRAATGLSIVLATALPAALPAQSRPESGFVAMSDGVQLYYEKFGSPGPLIMVPGRVFFGDELQKLGTIGTVIAYDMRNRGRSDSVRDSATLSIQQDVRDLDELRQHFAAGKVSLIGYSYLGLMVMLYTRDHQEHVGRVVQLGPVPLRAGTQYPSGQAAYPPAALADSTFAHKALAMRDARAHYERPREYCELTWLATRHNLVGAPEKADQLGPGLCHMPNEWPTVLERHFAAHFPSVRALNLTWREFEAIDVPVLTIHGDRDRNAPVGAGREWAANLPNARLLLVPGAAHRSWVDAPALVFDSIKAFLSGR